MAAKFSQHDEGAACMASKTPLFSKQIDGGQTGEEVHLTLYPDFSLSAIALQKDPLLGEKRRTGLGTEFWPTVGDSTPREVDQWLRKIGATITAGQHVADMLAAAPTLTYLRSLR